MSPLPISVEEYLATSYRPDCDYVDGEVVERNWGEYDHSRLQALFGAYLFERRNLWGITPLMEMTIQVKPSRYRIADLCVVLDGEKERILTKPRSSALKSFLPKTR